MSGRVPWSDSGLPYHDGVIFVQICQWHGGTKPEVSPLVYEALWYWERITCTQVHYVDSLVD
jgi:hypothetical protein